MRICDVEYNFNQYHNDLGVVIWVGPSSSVTDTESVNHGTAVIGIYGSAKNALGTMGIAYNAQKFFAAAKTSSVSNVKAAIENCVANTFPG